jgi:hypothetical protein
MGTEKEVIFQTDLSMIFISEAKAFLKEKRKSMLPDLIKKCKSDVSSGRILNEDLSRYLYDIFISEAENLLEKKRKKKQKQKVKKI